MKIVVFIFQNLSDKPNTFLDVHVATDHRKIILIAYVNEDEKRRSQHELLMNCLSHIFSQLKDRF